MCYGKDQPTRLYTRNLKHCCVSDQLLEMIKANRRLPTYQLWKNPLRNPVIMAAEGGGNYTESEEDNDV